MSPLFIGDHVALDFLNTLARDNGEDLEFLNDDQSVLAWLAQAGLGSDGAQAAAKERPGALTAAALDLRDASRALITSRKKGKRADPKRLNRYLALGSGYRQLEWSAHGPRQVVHRRTEAVEDLLVPVAEAVADLLSNGDFELVRQCEGPDCVLWFYDRTKSHRRRWCSMGLCGNRSKVAAFREREQKRR